MCKTSQESLNKDAWSVVRVSGAGAASYQRALRMAETATRLMPRNLAYLNTLAAAQYRMGAIKDAVATLALCSDLRGAPAPADLVFTAMARFKLGEAVSARVALEQLRTLMKEGTRSSNAELQSLLHEAEALIGGR